jgi:hypothetical protein
MIVLSCCLTIGPDQRRCMRTVREQSLHARHLMLDGPAPVCEKLVGAWKDLPNEEIIVWLDGDDYLAHERALERVQRAHDDGAWVTYGNFIWETHGGTVNWFKPPTPGVLPRHDHWYASLLRSFRAGLAKRIRDEDMRDLSGNYAGWVPDQRVMLAVCEMAGERAWFIPEVLAVYSGKNDGRPEELDNVRHIRGMQPYQVVEAL